jgi:hypothetical protein
MFYRDCLRLKGWPLQAHLSTVTVKREHGGLTMPLPIYRLAVEWRGFCYLAALLPGRTVFLCFLKDDGRNVEHI